jgi:hypothetical protein
VLVKALPTLPTSAPFAQTSGLIEKVSHLGSHVAKARRRAEDDGVGIRQLRWISDRDVGESRTGNGGTALFQYLGGDEFRHLPKGSHRRRFREHRR